MSSKNLILTIVFSVFVFLGIAVYQFARLSDGKLHVVFCDVGQGDAIFVRTPEGLDILVDGGPNDKVLSCLSSHMPFWDRKLELVILTHPHADHLNGLMSVVKRYKIISFATENLKNNTASFVTLMSELKTQNIQIRYVYAGDRFKFKDGVILNIVGPSREFLEKTSPKGLIGERSEFANVESIINYKNFSVLLTGDSQAVELREAVLEGRLKDIDVLQVPHHGSKTGLDSGILDILKPELAVISVGENNKYGHPAPSILKILGERDINPPAKASLKAMRAGILRTDRDGEVEIVYDGESWAVRN